MKYVADKVVFITGGAGGIGAASTKLLLGNGAKVFAVQRSFDKLRALQSECSSDNLAVKQCDITDEADVAAAFGECVDKFGRLDVLINNAGVGVATPDLANATIDDFNKQFEVNVKGSFLCTREALKIFNPVKLGHIINLVSQAGSTTNPTAPLYCASKFGQRGLSGGTADQALGNGIKVTDLNPGAVDTAYWGDRAVPREKFLVPEDIAQAILFVIGQPERVLIRQVDMVSMNQKK